MVFGADSARFHIRDWIPEHRGSPAAVSCGRNRSRSCEGSFLPSGSFLPQGLLDTTVSRSLEKPPGEGPADVWRTLRAHFREDRER
jgi:hypothetical protein